MNIDSTSAIHPLPYGATTNPLNSVFSDVDYVPIRGKIQTTEMTFNGTILLNRDDLCRALGIVNYNQYGIQDRNALSVCFSIHQYRSLIPAGNEVDMSIPCHG